MRSDPWPCLLRSADRMNVASPVGTISREAKIIDSMLLDFPGTPKLLNAELNRNHSYRKLSTGSIFAARAAGTVPNRMPTTAETTMATIAESPEMGMR
jgi:hypothetical protein